MKKGEKNSKESGLGHIAETGLAGSKREEGNPERDRVTRDAARQSEMANSSHDRRVEPSAGSALHPPTRIRRTLLYNFTFATRTERESKL